MVCALAVVAAAVVALGGMLPALGLMLAGVVALGSSPTVTSAGATGCGGPTCGR